jgi:hypothetical protein
MHLIIFYKYNNQLQVVIHGYVFLHIFRLISVIQPLGVQVPPLLQFILCYLQSMQVKPHLVFRDET